MQEGALTLDDHNIRFYLDPRCADYVFDFSCDEIIYE